MQKFMRSCLAWLRVFGFDPRQTIVALRTLPRYFRERRLFQDKLKPGVPQMGLLYPILHDYVETAGGASGHYFHMDLWAAKKIHRANPIRHLDIGSRIDGFVAHLLTFREVEVIDIRPIKSKIEGLHFIQEDATNLSQIPDESIESLSCLHAAEHFGLGRYGDPINPAAYRELLTAMARVLAPGGRLYFAVPIGRERVEFNAHRVFDPDRIVSELAPLELVDFSAVGDDGQFIKSVQPSDLSGAFMACGLYEFAKR